MSQPSTFKLSTPTGDHYVSAPRRIPSVTDVVQMQHSDRDSTPTSMKVECVEESTDDPIPPETNSRRPSSLKDVHQKDWVECGRRVAEIFQVKQEVDDPNFPSGEISPQLEALLENGSDGRVFYPSLNRLLEALRKRSPHQEGDFASCSRRLTRSIGRLSQLHAKASEAVESELSGQKELVHLYKEMGDMWFKFDNLLSELAQVSFGMAAAASQRNRLVSHISSVVRRRIVPLATDLQGDRVYDPAHSVMELHGFVNSLCMQIELLSDPTE